MVSNPGYFSQMATSGSLNQIEDGVDNPHTGLIKALSLGMAGNLVISGFAATSVTATTATIAAGVVLRNGKKVAISGSGVTLSTTYTTGYHLLVARSSALAVINPAAANKVPAYTAGDVPIAILAHTGSNPMQIQYFGTGKTENSVSIAHESGSAYSEVGTLTGDANGITMTGLYKLDTLPTATVATDDKVIVQDTNDSDKVKTVTAQSIADLSTFGAAQAVAAVEAESTLVLQSGVTVGTDLKLSTSSDNVIIENVTQDKDIIFQIDDGGVDTEVMRIDGDVSRVGIGTDSPDAKLHVEGDANDEVVLHITTTGGTSGSVQGKAHIGMSHFNSDTVPSATITVEEIDVSDHRANMTFSTRASGSSNAAPTEKMRITHDGKVGIGDTTPATELAVNGDVSGDKFLVESVQYELEILSNAGATPGPPTPAFSLADTDTIYRVSTVAGTPPGTGNIDLALPTTTNNQGLVFKLIVTALDGASALTIGPNSGDNIISETLSVLAASGATHVISSAGVYELVCFSGSWMFYKIV